MASSSRKQLHYESEARKCRHAAALSWCAALPVPQALLWLDRSAEESLDLALQHLFAGEDFPSGAAGELQWRRDPLGKPYVTWEGAVLAWAERQRRQAHCLHVSNSHDGDAHLILAAYAEDLVGIGIDVVALPRLRQAGKDTAYLRRFARRFMSPDEWAAFEEAAAQEAEEALRRRVAAHFSLMEAASKACGTGLKIGIGLGHPASLSMHALGARRLTPAVELLFGPEARARLADLGARRWEGYWGADHEYLVSAVLLWR